MTVYDGYIYIGNVPDFIKGVLAYMLLRRRQHYQHWPIATGHRTLKI